MQQWSNGIDDLAVTNLDGPDSLETGQSLHRLPHRGGPV